MRGLSARAPVGIKDMMRGDILGKLVVNILKPDHELGNYLMQFLGLCCRTAKAVLASGLHNGKVRGIECGCPRTSQSPPCRSENTIEREVHRGTM